MPPMTAAAQEDVFDGRVRGGRLDRLDRIPEADGGNLGAAHERGRAAEGELLRLFGEDEFVVVDVQDPFARKDRLGAAGKSGRTGHAEKEDESEDPDDEQAAEDGQHHFDKIFHLIAY